MRVQTENKDRNLSHSEANPLIFNPISLMFLFRKQRICKGVNLFASGFLVATYPVKHQK